MDGSLAPSVSDSSGRRGASTDRVFDETHLENPGIRDRFRRKDKENACSLVGELIDFDHSEGETGRKSIRG